MEYRLDFGSYLLLWPEPFFTPKSTHLYMEVMDGLSTKTTADEHNTTYGKDGNNCICR
jgi:hypothetical protein